MPMDFPDMDSLIEHADMHMFRKPNPDETEAEFREALAVYVAEVDLVEAEEIRHKVGHDKWTPGQSMSSMFRALDKPRRNN